MVRDRVTMREPSSHAMKADCYAFQAWTLRWGPGFPFPWPPASALTNGEFPANQRCWKLSSHRNGAGRNALREPNVGRDDRRAHRHASSRIVTPSRLLD